MSFSPHVWDQLRSISADELIQALLKDSWTYDTGSGSIRIYKKGDKRVTVHYHPQKTFGPKLLKGLLRDIGWTPSDLRLLKLIK